MPDTSTNAAAIQPSSRGEESRLRILRAALKVFADRGFDLATTRRIADAADVNLPAIKYYFEGKEGLYLACARYIVDRYRRTVGPDVFRIASEVDEGLLPDAARARLKDVVRLLVGLGTSEADAPLWTGFVLREMSERGPAFDILYDGLWSPGVQLTANLVAQVRGRPRANEADKVRALLLQASLTAFSSTAPVSFQFLDWPERGGVHTDVLFAQLDAEIDAIC